MYDLLSHASPPLRRSLRQYGEPLDTQFCRPRLRVRPFVGMATQLLYEHGDPSILAFADQTGRPSEVHRATAGLAFAADDDPMDPEGHGFVASTPFLRHRSEEA